MTDNLTFIFTDLEMDRWHKFMRHRCPKRKDGYNPTPQVLISPNAIGDGIDLLCPCGKKVDITDYKSW